MWLYSLAFTYAWQLGLATVVTYFQYYASAVFLVKHLPLKLTAGEKVVLSLVLGLGLNAALLFFVGHASAAVAYFLLYGLVGLALWQLKLSWSWLTTALKALWLDKKLFIVSLLCTLSLAAPLLLSWIVTPQGLLIQDGQLHDSAWHLALINKLLVSFPPEHPSDYTLVVSNYHYFYDLVIAIMAHNYGLDINRLYFQFWPLVLSALLVGSVVTLTQRLVSGKLLNTFRWWSLLLTFFGGSFAYFIPLFLPAQPWTESSFWVSQTFVMMLNPQMIYSLSLLLVVIWLLHSTFNFKNNLKNWSSLLTIHLVVMFLIVSSLGFKSYSFVVMGFMYGGFLLIQLLRTRSWQYLVFGGVFLVMALPFLWLITGFKSSSFIWLPLWYLSSMVEAADRLNLPHWKLQEEHFLATNNWLRLTELKLRELVIFVVGNLGTRSFLLTAPLWFLTKKLRFSSSAWQQGWPTWVLIVAGLLFSATFPLLFLQNGVVWNSIQFWYYALVLANLCAAGLLTHLTTQVNQRWLKWLLATLFVALTLPTYLTTQWYKVSHFQVIPNDKLQLLAKIQPHSRVLICPAGGDLYQTSLVSAITNSSLYLANTVQLGITSAKYQHKETALQVLALTNQMAPLQKLVSEEKIAYLLCNSTQWSSFQTSFHNATVETAQDWSLLTLPVTP